MANLQVNAVDRGSGVVVVALVGSADIAGAAVLDRAMTGVSAKHPQHVVFDMAGVTFIASLAMGVIMQFRRGCVAWGGRVSLAALTPSVAGAIRHAALEKMLPIAESVDAAIASPADGNP